MSAITLLTDFGLRDPFVGEMKGVLLRLAPACPVVDLTHGISAGGIREAAWVLAKAWRGFPEGTCHLAVVDPGVGGERRPLVARGGGHYFVGPDNGILSAVFEEAAELEIRELTWREIDHPRRGTTFDGRDVFAPAAARLASGMPLEEAGPEVHDPETLPSFRPVPAGGGFDVEIVRVDRFGNLVTSLEHTVLLEHWGEDWRSVRARVGDRVIEGVRLSYDGVDPGEPLLTVGGSGTLEVSVNRGSARHLLGVDAGETVRVEGPQA